jgi:hypothetical protein
VTSFLNYQFRFFAVLGCIVLPEAGVLVEVVDDLVPAEEDEGLGGHHHQRCHDPEEVEQGCGTAVPEKKILQF